MYCVKATLNCFTHPWHSRCNRFEFMNAVMMVHVSWPCHDGYGEWERRKVRVLKSKFQEVYMHLQICAMLHGHQVRMRYQKNHEKYRPRCIASMHFFIFFLVKRIHIKNNYYYTMYFQVFTYMYIKHDSWFYRRLYSLLVNVWYSQTIQNSRAKTVTLWFSYNITKQRSRCNAKLYYYVGKVGSIYV